VLHRFRPIERVSVIRRLMLAVAVLALVSFASGCAVTDAQDQLGSSAYSPRPEDPARIGLPQPYRVFIDELEGEGDWTLIEPYGYVFRPRVNFVAWRPYQDGWWEPSDYYGWIWNTYEPFGWVTYHYGAWFYDEYQGWVWQPGGVWGPAWVAWVDTGDFVGWAPLPPTTYDDFDRIPDGVFTFAPVQQFAARNVGKSAVYLSRLPQNTSTFREIVNVGHANGAVFNRGPDPVVLMQRGGGVGERFDDSTLPRVKLAATVARNSEADLQSRTNRIVAVGRAQLRRMVETGVAPPPSSGGGAPGAGSLPPAVAPRIKPPARPAIPDSVRERRAARPRVPADSSTVRRKPGTPKRGARPLEAAPDSTRHE
jgi:hypothetical protein